MEEILGNFEKLERELKVYKFSKHISYPFIPVICFESSSKGYIHNPYLKKYNVNEEQPFISLLDGGYEAWGDWSKRSPIKNEQVEEIMSDCLIFLEHHREQIDTYTNQSFKNISTTQLLETVKGLDTIITNLYQLYIFFIDEWFDCTDKNLQKRLPEVRMSLSACATKLYKGCDSVIAAFANMFPECAWETFMYATISELEELIIHPQENRENLKTYLHRPIAFLTINNQFHTLIGKEVDKLETYLKQQDENNIVQNLTIDNNRFSGTIAVGGNAKGKVVLLSADEYDKAAQILENKKDYILVLPMTRPEFIPLMKGTLAIVTDEGGMTCHATIVARELHIPCIVGTKIATKVLKDGDLVEVDADKGIITILKHK